MSEKLPQPPTIKIATESYNIVIEADRPGGLIANLIKEVGAAWIEGSVIAGIHLVSEGYRPVVIERADPERMNIGDVVRLMNEAIRFLDSDTERVVIVCKVRDGVV